MSGRVHVWRTWAPETTREFLSWCGRTLATTHDPTPPTRRDGLEQATCLSCLRLVHKHARRQVEENQASARDAALRLQALGRSLSRPTPT